MDLELVEKVANAVLYEGYMLYPYRALSVKNRQRFNWGALVPKAYSDAQKGTESWEIQTECLIAGDEKTQLNIKVRFLHLTNREIGKVETPTDKIPDEFEPVPSLEVNGRLVQAWQEAVERDVEVPPISLTVSKTKEFDFSFPAMRTSEPVYDATSKVAGVIVRTLSTIQGTVKMRIADCGLRSEENSLKFQISGLKYQTEEADKDHSGSKNQKTNLFKITVRVCNTTPFENAEQKTREDALLSSIVSTHAILSVTGGEFVSLLEPPEEYTEIAASCKNVGAFPVLVGTNASRDCMLASPIILYDYPEIAPESPGNLFDSTEIDEILTLRIMTMTEQEKREMRSVDDRARKILERAEFMSDEELLGMHGTLRGMERSRKASYG